jgi:hypothetical protein
MAPSGPARSLLQEIRVIDVSDENVPGYFLLLEMAFQAERSVALIQQALVNRAVRRVANSTSLANCFMFIDERAALLCVTLKASFVSAQESEAAAFECLLNVRRRTFKCDPLVWVVTVAATHFPFRYRMMVR